MTPSLNKSKDLRGRTRSRPRCPFRWGVGLSLILICAAACSTTSVPSDTAGREPHAPLIVARSGDAALLSWQSRLGEEYTVLYADGRRYGVDWQPLPGAARITGNGQEIRLQDRMLPGIPRFYRLMVVPAGDRMRLGR